MYNVGVDFVVKLGEQAQARRFAVLEYATGEDEWPGHTHPTEDEGFYVLKGALTFRCGAQEFDVDEGGFVFLPNGIEHGYRIRGGGEARFLVITAPAPAPARPRGGAASSPGSSRGADPEGTPAMRTRRNSGGARVARPSG